MAVTGKVYIVGAGPGDPELLTLKAVQALRECEVVVYDRLVSSEILALAPAGAARIFAGKECRKRAMAQDDINSLLVMLASKGKRVVRLKGGDPFIFGRGGEEALYLTQHNIPFEVIPGVTSASASSAIAGIPLTYRGLSQGVSYVTGHLQNETDEPNWRALADSKTTLVIYMGLTRLEQIARKLQKAGLPSDFPAAVIENASLPNQRVIVGTLSTLANQAQQEKIASPALIIVGKVVALSGVLARPSQRPPQTKVRQAAPVRRRRASV